MEVCLPCDYDLLSSICQSGLNTVKYSFVGNWCSLLFTISCCARFEILFAALNKAILLIEWIWKWYSIYITQPKQLEISSVVWHIWDYRWWQMKVCRTEIQTRWNVTSVLLLHHKSTCKFIYHLTLLKTGAFECDKALYSVLQLPPYVLSEM